jgi:hypothetical protein
MHNIDFVPSADGKFNEWQGILFAYLFEHAAAWGVPSDKAQATLALKAAWEVKFAAAENPATRTSAAVLAKSEARKAYEAPLRILIKAYVTYNPLVGDEDRVNMGLPIHSEARTPAPVPTTYPEMEVDSSVIRRLSIHFRDSGGDKKAKPAGVHGAEIRWAILPAPPAKVSEVTNSAFDTRTPFTLAFEEDQRGKTVYFCLCWENTRGEKGPWSEIVSAIVP